MLILNMILKAQMDKIKIVEQDGEIIQFKYEYGDEIYYMIKLKDTQCNPCSGQTFSDDCTPYVTNWVVAQWEFLLKIWY